MPPKRKRTEQEEHEDDGSSPTYASEVGWLACLTDPSGNPVASEEDADEETNTALINAACKLTYILYHDIEVQDCLRTILEFLNKVRPEDDGELARVARYTQSAWKGHIVNKFLLPHVKEIVRKWCVARPYASFGSLSERDRIKIWSEAYDAEPKKTVILMWKPVIGVLDLALIFRTDLPAEDRARMSAIRKMLREKYVFGCECTYKHNVADTKKIQKQKTLDDWALYAKFSNCASSIVPFADLPISPATLRIASLEAPVKTAKKTTPEDAFETASLSSTIDPSNVATATSAVSDSASGERCNPPKISSFLSGLPNTLIISSAPSLPTYEKQEPLTEPSSALQDLINGPSSATGLTRGGRKNPGPCQFPAQKDLPPRFQPAPEPIMLSPHSACKQEENTEPSTFLQDLIDGPSADQGVAHQGGRKGPNYSAFFVRKDGLPASFRPRKPSAPSQAPMTEEDRRFYEYFGTPIKTSVNTMASEAPMTEEDRRFREYFGAPNKASGNARAASEASSSATALGAAFEDDLL